MDIHKLTQEDYPQTKRKTVRGIIPLSFYRRECVVTIARELLGKHLFSSGDGIVTGGIITETEAYAGAEDRASHAYNNRRTKRTEVMFQDGGLSYIYFCYGMHHLLNVVTHTKGTPHAVLIRSIYPTEGIDTMLERRGKKKLDPTLTCGPGTVCQALGLTLQHNALPLTEPPLWIEDRDLKIATSAITASARIGVAYAQEDALLPYRFTLAFTR